MSSITFLLIIFHKKNSHFEEQFRKYDTLQPTLYDHLSTLFGQLLCSETVIIL